MPDIGRHQIPGLLLIMVPESRDGIEAVAGMSAEQAVSGDLGWFDLYDFLRDVVFRDLVRPELLAPEAERDTELLGRCAEFAENLLLNSTQPVASAVFYQLVEPLYASEELLVAAIPQMQPEMLRVTFEDMAVDRLSASARAALADYLH
ncbi:MULTISPECIES: hypothetical protein [Streptomyces]|uniref:hypothetical protein n=1 Tax=Streptomyces TaxID=1883 RepID=UPI002E2958B2|nr:hypothetical protein [Streptomyces sp. NBC_01453]